MKVNVISPFSQGDQFDQSTEAFRADRSVSDQLKPKKREKFTAEIQGKQMFLSGIGRQYGKLNGLFQFPRALAAWYCLFKNMGPNLFDQP